MEGTKAVEGTKTKRNKPTDRPKAILTCEQGLIGPYPTAEVTTDPGWTEEMTYLQSVWGLLTEERRLVDIS